jgi:hypothetical protein
MIKKNKVDKSSETKEKICDTLTENKYYLVSKRTNKVLDEVIIDETNKEAFKKMMDWDEEEFKRNTILVDKK